MDWVKLATDYYTDQRVEALSTDAELMFVRGLARAGELERGGFIPESSLARLARRRRYATLVSELVCSGLWNTAAGGYQIASWTDWQDRLDSLAERRTADRERQRKRRLRLRDHGESTGSRDNGKTSRDVTHPEGEEDLETPWGVSVRDPLTPRARDRPPPPETCQRHPNGTDQPCGPCKSARILHEIWQTDQAAARAERQRNAPRCPTHPTEPADHCRPCRSERLARTETP